MQFVATGGIEPRTLCSTCAVVCFKRWFILLRFAVYVVSERILFVVQFLVLIALTMEGR